MGVDHNRNQFWVGGSAGLIASKRIKHSVDVTWRFCSRAMVEVTRVTLVANSLT